MKCYCRKQVIQPLDLVFILTLKDLRCNCNKCKQLQYIKAVVFGISVLRKS